MCVSLGFPCWNPWIWTLLGHCDGIGFKFAVRLCLNSPSLLLPASVWVFLIGPVWQCHSSWISASFSEAVVPLVAYIQVSSGGGKLKASSRIINIEQIPLPSLPDSVFRYFEPLTWFHGHLPTPDYGLCSLLQL